MKNKRMKIIKKIFSKKFPIRSRSKNSLQRREVPWEKVPFVPRPSLIADPITAFGKKKSLLPENENRRQENGSLVLRLKKEIKAAPESKLRPLEAYKSPRDLTRERVNNEIHRQQKIREAGGLTPYLTDAQSMDMVLPRLHGRNDNFQSREFDRPIY
jgi:hypothetical protein